MKGGPNYAPNRIPSTSPCMAASDFHLEAIRARCAAWPGVTEGFPFDEKTLVFKVGGKLFALADTDHFDSINLKCDPERAVDLRARFAGIQPGWHMNKVHWNTVEVRNDVPAPLLWDLLRHSYLLVASGLPARARRALFPEGLPTP